MPSWLEDADLHGCVAVVTGPTSGLGLETAKQLDRRGAHVVLACRDLAKGEAVAAQLASATVIHLDLADLRTVRSFVDEFERRFDVLDILVNNGGVSTVFRGGRPSLVWPGDLEETFVVNHLAHFALTLALLPAIGRGAGQQPARRAARIVHVSSRANRRAPLDAGWLEPATAAAWLASSEHMRTSADLMGRYGIAKLAQLAFATELDRRARAGALPAICGRALHSNSVHPGIVATGILRETYKGLHPLLALLVGAFVRVRRLFVGLDVQRGSLPQLWCALADDVERSAVHGQYVVPARAEAGVRVHTPEHPWAQPGPALESLGARVWAMSAHLLEERGIALMPKANAQ